MMRILFAAFCLFPAWINLLTVVVGQDDQSRNEKRDITWTEVPTVDQQDPTLHRGIVYGPEGEPLAGAKIYAASTIELFELAAADEVTSEDLGKVRAITDGLGRFEFHTPDLTWSPVPGQRKRWEALLVARKDGVAPGWIATWGEDRGRRSHWHPHSSKKVAIHMEATAQLRGRLLLGRQPLEDAGVRVTALRIPRDGDLDKHIERLKKMGPFSSFSYKESFYRPWVLPGISTETRTDDDGRFVLENLPNDYIVQLDITHPAAKSTKLTIAVRDMDDIFGEPLKAFGQKEPRLLLRGSGFTHELPAGVTLKGQVRMAYGVAKNKPVAGATIATANHNAADGISGHKFTTDKEGRFEITGLGQDHGKHGYDVAVIGSYGTPIEARRFTIWPDHEAILEVPPAVPYRLTLTDSMGNPIDREVFSMDVQTVPGQMRQRVSHRFNAAKRVETGVYEGLVPNRIGAVMVKRGSQRDRPVFVDVKGFFEPGRTDWTAAEKRYAYGNHWEIIQPGIRTPGLAANANLRISQLDYADIVLTRGGTKNAQLELSATVTLDNPTNVTLVDESGKPVKGARVLRQFSRYNAKGLPATVPLYGLHPQRAEYIQFQHEDRRLIGFVRATLTNKPIRVVMKPRAMLTGRLVKVSGETCRDFGVLFSGAVKPDTFTGNFIRKTKIAPKGRFAVVVPPDEQYSGILVRKSPDWRARPSVGQAFAPVTPKPGQIIDFGDIVVP